MTTLNFPNSPSNGDAYNGYVYDSSITAWKRDIFGRNRFYISATAPTGAIPADLWFDSEELVLYTYYEDEDGEQWVQLIGEPGIGLPIGGITGQVLAKSSNDSFDFDWVDVATSISSLTDVDLSELVDGNALVYDSASGNWIPGESGGSSFTTSELPPAEPENGDVWFNSTSGKTYIYYEDEDSAQWVEIASNTVGYLDLGQLNDVTIVSPTTGQALTYNGTAWVNSTPATTLDSLTDAVISSPVNGEVLKYNGTEWINDTIEEPNYASDQAILASQIFG